MKMRPTDATLFEPWIGKQMTSFIADEGDDSVSFEFERAPPLKLTHFQDCCEDVAVFYMDEDFADVRGKVITGIHSYIYGDEFPPGWDTERFQFYASRRVPGESFTFTLIVFETATGIRRQMLWLGTSNGYYGETIDVEDHPKEKRCDTTVGE